jgi:hypothetical protein
LLASPFRKRTSVSNRTAAEAAPAQTENSLHRVDGLADNAHHRNIDQTYSVLRDEMEK